MHDIRFTCPQCDQSLACDIDGAGCELECPACGKRVTVPLTEDATLRNPPLNDVASSHSDSPDGLSMGSMMTMAEKGSPGDRMRIGSVLVQRYEIRGKLGQGGMGAVYRCFDKIGGIDVAVKSIPPELSHNTIEMEEVRDNFRLVERLHHPRVAAIKSLEKDPDTGDYYLIMECVEGLNLRQYCRSHGSPQPGRGHALPLEKAIGILQQVAAALDYAHGQQIMHRDIKPSNIMVAADGTVKVLDFGLASQIHTSMSRVSRIVFGTSGTGPYMAPEQWQGKYQDESTDQYALAIVAYELLNGRAPFESHEVSVLKEAVMNAEPDPIETLTLPQWQALSKAMKKERGDRYPSCEAFVQSLETGKIVRRAFGRRKIRPRTSIAAPVGLAAGIVLILAASVMFVPRATIQIDTAPQGAFVRVGSLYKGTTPVVFPSVFPWYRWPVKVTKRGYDERHFRLHGLSPGEVLSVPTIRLVNSEKREVTVLTDPPGAIVTAEGESLGETPLKVSRMAVGEYDIELDRFGYRTHEERISVREEGTNEFRFLLELDPASIRVVSVPGEAHVRVDPVDTVMSWHMGEAEAAPWQSEDDVPAGSYKVTALKDGYLPTSKVFRVAGGQKATVEIAMEQVGREHMSFSVQPPVGRVIWLKSLSLPKGNRPIEKRGVLAKAVLPHGKYQVGAEAPNHMPAVVSFTVAAESNKIIHVKCNKLRPWLQAHNGLLGAQAWDDRAMSWKAAALADQGDHLCRWPILADGVVYAATYSGEVSALMADDFTVLWSQSVHSPLAYGPVMDDEGHLLIATKDGHLFCLGRASGKKLWQISLGNGSGCEPAVIAKYVFVSAGNQLSKYHITSRAKRWSVTLPASVTTPIATDKQRLWIGCANGAVLCLDPSDGRTLWSKALFGEVRAGPIVASRKLIVGTWGGETVALDVATGNEVWRTLHAAPVLRIAAVPDETQVIIGLHSGALLRASTKDGARQASATVAAGIADMMVGAESALILTDAGGIYTWTSGRRPAKVGTVPAGYGSFSIEERFVCVTAFGGKMYALR